MTTPTPESVLSAEDLAEAYALHPSDHPGLLLVSTAFDGSSFGSWKRAMTIALSTKGKLYFVDGSLPRPASTSPDHKKWSKCNDMVMSWILNVLRKSIADSIIYAKTARQMWVELEERFGQINGAKLYQIKKDIWVQRILHLILLKSNVCGISWMILMKFPYVLVLVLIKCLKENKIRSYCNF